MFQDKLVKKCSPGKTQEMARLNVDHLNARNYLPKMKLMFFSDLFADFLSEST